MSTVNIMLLHGLSRFTPISFCARYLMFQSGASPWGKRWIQAMLLGHVSHGAVVTICRSHVAVAALRIQCCFHWAKPLHWRRGNCSGRNHRIGWYSKWAFGVTYAWPFLWPKICGHSCETVCAMGICCSSPVRVASC